MEKNTEFTKQELFCLDKICSTLSNKIDLSLEAKTSIQKLRVKVQKIILDIKK